MLSSNAQDIVDIVWGNSKLTLMDKFNNWFWGHDTLRLPKFNATVVTSRLSKYGLTDEQIYIIREQCMESMLLAREHTVRKHNIISDYLSHIASSFGVYQLCLNVGENVLNEFADMAYKLFYIKLQKLDVGYIGKGQ